MNDMPNERPTIETSRLLLRPFELSDALDVQRLAGDRAIADTTDGIPHPYPDGAAEEWIGTHEELFETEKLVSCAVTSRSSGELLGAVSLMDISRAHDRAEIGYWIGKPHWNQGFCTEAAAALVAWGFESLRLHRIFGRYLRRNAASGRVLAKIGMREEGCLREHVKKWKALEDLVLCGILRSEWASVHESLEGKRSKF